MKTRRRSTGVPPVKTGLANEEVNVGKCDRCGEEVVRKDLRQWILRITDYAEKLLAGLDDLNWPEALKSMQRNWIGRSVGANVVFPLADHDGSIEVYTTRPDTLFGATYMVLAPEHHLVEKITTDGQKSAVEDYIEGGPKKVGPWKGPIWQKTKRESSPAHMPLIL